VKRKAGYRIVGKNVAPIAFTQ